MASPDWNAPASDEGVLAEAARDDSRIGRIFAKLAGGPSDASWIMPDGTAAERCGGKRAGLALAWSDDGGGETASACRDFRKACASSDSVTWRCHPAQFRTS